MTIAITCQYNAIDLSAHKPKLIKICIHCTLSAQLQTSATLAPKSYRTHTHICGT